MVQPTRHLQYIQHSMVNPIICWGVTLVLLWVAAPAQAQTLLVQLQQKAVNDRALVHKYRLRLEAAQRQTAIQRGKFWPSLDLGYRANALGDNTPIESKENSRLGGILSYNLFNGFRDHYNLAAAKEAEMLRAYQLVAVSQDLQLDIALLYLDLYEKITFLSIVDDQLALIDKRLVDTQNRFDVGLVSKNEVLRLTVEKNEVMQKKRQAWANVKKSRNQLGFATGSTITPDQLVFDEFDQLPGVEDVAALKKKMFEHRSELKVLKKAVVQLKKTAQATRAKLWPTADISAGYARFGDDFYLDKEDQYEDETRIQLNVNINLFDGFQKYERIKQAELAVTQAQIDVTELENRLITELNNRYIDLTVARENLIVAQSAIAEAEENVRITEEASKAGVETATDMLNAILNLSTARFNQTTARNNVFRNHFYLQRTVDGFPTKSENQ